MQESCGQANRTGVHHTAFAFEEFPGWWQVSRKPSMTMPEEAENAYVPQERMGEGGEALASPGHPCTNSQRTLSDSGYSAS